MTDTIKNDLKINHSNVSSDFENSSDSSYVETPIHSWKGRLWDSWDKPQKERWFLFKLDFLLMFIAGSGVFLRYLDQANINNAFVSGMKEDLNLYGNELNYANTCWSIGYAIAQIPSNLLLSKLKTPHYYIAFLEIGWSVLTFCSASFNGPKSMYGIRFLIGVLEAGHFPAVMYIASSWYTKSELSKRISIIQFNTSTGPLISAFLQTAAYNGLNGTHGRAGWRWLFIVDGIISLPLAVLVVFLLPDIPRTQKPNWIFSNKEIELAKKRVPTEVKIHATFRKSDILSWLGTWHVYFFSISFILEALSGLPSSSLPFWFKSFNTKTHIEYTVGQINNYSAPLYAIRILATVIQGYISDDLLKGKRWIIIAFNGIVMFCLGIALATTLVHPSDRAGRWTLYYLIGIYANGAQAWTWVNEATMGEPSKRAFVGAVMNAFVYAFTSFVPIFAFPTQDQPFVKKGNIMSACLALVSVFFAIGGGYIEHLKLRSGFFRSVPLKDIEDDGKIEDSEASAGDVKKSSEKNI
ncbi:Pantothenate transporter [Wickerhamomyces ciferrii]|uniref:Pantothenate transporter n=1 Tax=Wickerhamomyces ciferrii (strain ATCC 14091 / BCRC 22168 / CBS 111 / JCM 3599 / NBRC 0793 / NRRL Y-1031 F-60-10) TaxID=1206466 RepID=K0KSC3_WICCF|nr:Pantothenate transporter [Wickerhamomyces ciferrii]CCH44233.1 Pantothenate transporter [Wickerhamomyces ciferrii]